LYCVFRIAYLTLSSSVFLFYPRSRTGLCLPADVICLQALIFSQCVSRLFAVLSCSA